MAEQGLRTRLNLFFNQSQRDAQRKTSPAKVWHPNALRNLALLLGVLLAVLVETTRFQLIPRMSWLFDIRQNRRIVPTPEHGNDLKGQTSGRAKAHPLRTSVKTANGQP